MEYAKKMIVVPPELLEQLRPSVGATSKIPSSTTSGGIDEEMNRILNDNSLDDREKWKMYQQVLQRFLHFADQKREPIGVPIVDTHPTGDMDIIVESFPTTYQRDVRNLLRYILRNPNILRWDQMGTIYVNDQVVPGTHIEDILHCIVRDRKLARQPNGWKEVMNALITMNVPHEYINNESAQRYLAHRGKLRSTSPSGELHLHSPPPPGQRRVNTFSPYPRRPRTRTVTGVAASSLHRWEYMRKGKK